HFLREVLQRACLRVGQSDGAEAIVREREDATGRLDVVPALHAPAHRTFETTEDRCCGLRRQLLTGDGAYDRAEEQAARLDGERAAHAAHDGREFRIDLREVA